MDEYQNFFKLHKFSLRFYHFCIIDTQDYLFDSIARDNQVRMKFWKNELVRPDDDYSIIFCKVFKKDIEKFLDSLEQLKNKMLICGHTDYPDVCMEIQNYMEEYKTSNS